MRQLTDARVSGSVMRTERHPPADDAPRGLRISTRVPEQKVEQSIASCEPHREALHVLMCSPTSYSPCNPAK